MERVSKFFEGSPFNIALAYALFGGIWVFSTDQLVLLYVDDPALISQLQTAKGWIYVALSAVLVYMLVFYSQQELKETNERLDEELQRSSIMQRILRHNLRNSCNVIQANAEAIHQHLSGNPEASLNTIKSQNQRLIELSEKSKLLRDMNLGQVRSDTQLDLVKIVTTQMEKLTDEYPETELQVELPDTLWVESTPLVEEAIFELLENAVEHNDSTPPIVTISAHVQTKDTVVLDIADNGPGMPEMERKVLEEGFEKPLMHSHGLGLWTARALVVNTGGSFQIVDNQPRGTNIRLTFQSPQNQT